MYQWNKPIRTLLCIGAHSDDIEIGAGGTVLQLLAGNDPVQVVWVVLSADGVRAEEARDSARRFLAKADESDVRVAKFHDGYFPVQMEEIKEYFEDLKTDLDPDVILTHHEQDRHQDHRTVCELTWNTFRDHSILEYEIPKYDGDLGRPNLFVPLMEEQRRAKVDYLLEVFATQRGRRWFTRETFDALMRLRGMECNAHSGYAEAFHARKLTWDMTHPPDT